tara:strand:+ start:2375 stop:3697 length:1323 start_codon:yes stop_codon:yes gene_type:complete
MSLTIIINVSELSGELRDFMYFLGNKWWEKWRKIIINTQSGEVMDYITENFSEWENPTISFTKIMSIKLEDLVKNCIANDLSKQTDYYLAISSFSPNLTVEYLNNLYNDFLKSGSRHGYLLNSMERVFDLTSKKVIEDSDHLHVVNKNIYFLNRSSSRVSSIRYMISPFNLDYRPIKKLLNKNILLFGALGGIGSKIAEKYYNEGYTIHGIDILNSNKLNSDQQHVYDNILNGKYHVMDLSVENRFSPSITRATKRIIEGYMGSNLHGLIISSGYQYNSSLLSTSSKEWDKTINVNLKAIWKVSKTAHKYLKKTNGFIVVINSIHAYCSSKNIGAYAVSKAGLIGLVRNCAIEWGQDGITVNSIAPGAIDTKMLRDGLTRRGQDLEKAKVDLQARHIMGKIGKPEEIAELTYMISNCRFMTGQTIIVDGGASLILSTEAI